MAKIADTAVGAEPQSAERTRRHGRRLPTLAAAFGMATLLSVPLLVALFVLREPRLFPIADMAQIELRVRDVATLYPPMTGLGGRIAGYGVSGSHPGPLSFYALWPVYQILGADGWALQASSVVLNLTALGVALWIALRRGGWPFAAAVAVVLVLLMRGFGAVLLAEPWNPHIPVIWWVVFLLAVWGVLCGDLPMLPIAVFAGSMCAQTHIPYVPLVGGLWVLTAAILVVRLHRNGHAAGQTGRLRRWMGVSMGLLLVLWLPPVIEQFARDPGNFEVIVESVRHPRDDQVSFGAAARVWLTHLNPWELVSTDRASNDAPRPGLLLLAVWTVAVVVAWRRQQVTVLKLHAVAGVAAALGLLAISRIVGPLWPYLTLWAWGTTALILLAILCTLLSTTTAPLGPDVSILEWRWAGRTAVAVGAVALGLTAFLTIDAARSEAPHIESSETVRHLAAQTIQALAQDPVGCGDDCSYLVIWPALHLEGDGLRMALERAGFDARARPREVSSVRPSRIIDPDDADAVLQVASDEQKIAELRGSGDAREIAYAEPRTTGDLPDRQQARRQIVEWLEGQGLDDLAADIDVEGQARIRLDERVPADLRLLAAVGEASGEPAPLFLLVPENPRELKGGQETRDDRDEIPLSSR